MSTQTSTRRNAQRSPGPLGVGVGAILLTTLAVLSVGCVEEVAPARFADRNYTAFTREVYPVLLRDCGFPDCHGATERFFRVVGPGRVRVPNVGEDLPDPLDTRTQAELDMTIDFALSMIDDRDPERSLLLRKPLAVEAGGAGHLGVDNYGRNVYRTTQDSGYVVLARWVLNQTEASP